MEKGKKGDRTVSAKRIDKIIHEPARMSIMANLYLVDGMDAIFLLRQTDLTWGNLATHTKKLEAAGYIRVRKEFVMRKPRTMFSLTRKGRAAFEAYRKHMKRLFED